MRKKIFVAMMIGCMILGGCGGSGDSTATTDSDNYEAEYDAEDDVSDMDTEYSDEENTTDGETEVEEYEDVTEPSEAKGIVAMVSINMPQTTDIQIITIDPLTGKQSIISTFHVERRNDVTYDWSDTFYGNMADQFSDDFSKMAITKIFTNNNEAHAGWVDRDGEFFDVTESIEDIQGQGFSNPDPVHQRSAGFKDEMFILYDDLDFFGEGFTREADVYYVTVDTPSQKSIIQADENDLYITFNDFARNVNLPSWIFATEWLGETIFITDVYDEKIENPQSIIVNLETGEQHTYIPDANRLNWSGVVSPDGEQIAFLSVPKNSVGLIGLYTIPVNGGEPTIISVAANKEASVDFTTLTGDTCPYRWAVATNGANYSCYLLDWR